MGSRRHLTGLLYAALIGAVEALLTRMLGLSELWSLLIAAVTLAIVAPILARRALTAPHHARQHDRYSSGASATSKHDYVTAIQCVLRDGDIVWRDSRYVGHETKPSRQWHATTLDLEEPPATVRPAKTRRTSTERHALQTG